MNARQLHHRLIHTRRQRAMFQFLLVDGSVFLAGIAVYLVIRQRAPMWPTALHFASALMASAMTLFTLAGSFTMAAAAREQEKGDVVLPVRLVAATVALWGAFLICDAMEWARLLFFEHVTPATNPWRVPAYGATFYGLTGYHGLHVLAGSFYLIAVAANVKRSDVGASALFVHFTNAIWLVIFIVVYLSGFDLRGL